jgi:predicted DNA-binding protein
VKYAKFSKPLTVAFTEETYNRLKEVSDEKKVSMAEIVREIVSRRMAKAKS